MAIPEPIPHPMHPATARQARYAAWTQDPAVAQLLSVLRDLDAIGARLQALHRRRPDLGADALRSEVGEIARLYERTSSLAYREGATIRANGGACAGLWALLAQRRNAWIEARLEAEGFPLHAADPEKTARVAMLADAAEPVDQLWKRFSEAGDSRT